MTIYKPNSNPDQKQEKKLISAPDVVIDGKLPLRGKAKNGGAAVLFVRRSPSNTTALRRMMLCVVVLMVCLLVVLAVFSAGVIIYRRLYRMPAVYECNLSYRDDSIADPGTAEAQRSGEVSAVKTGYYDEKVEVDQANGAYEKLEVPPILDFRRSTVVHDFDRNYTGIVDLDHGRCFVMALNRSAVTQPKSFIDLLEKFKSGYYVPNAEVVRDTYRVQLPSVDDIDPYGPYIGSECQYFDTFLLVKDDRPTVHLSQPIMLSRKTRSVGCSMAGNGFCLGNTFSDGLHCIRFTDCIQ